MTTRLPADAQQREEALDTRRSFIVEAPAGSGKTALLIQRYLKLLLDEEVLDPSQVLAITFTNKATQEVRNRVVAALSDAAQGKSYTDEFKEKTLAFARQVNVRDAQLGWRLLDQPSRMNIRTIDSLAAEIARTLPILSGGFGLLNPTEQASEMYHTAARRTLQRLGGSDPELNAALRMVLLHRDASLRDVEGLLAGMLQKRDQWMRLVPLDDEHLTDEHLDATLLPRLDVLLATAVCERLRIASEMLPAEFKPELLRLMRAVCERPGYQGGDNPYIEHFENRHEMPGTGVSDLEAWRHIFLLIMKADGWRKALSGNHVKVDLTGKQAKELKMDLEAFIQSVQSDALFTAFDNVRNAPPHEYPRDQWPLVKALLRLMKYALADLKEVFAQSGTCDFTEVSLAAQHALKTPEGPSDYAAALGTHLRHIVMDEVQDTSLSQYSLLKTLISSWDGYSQTVFLVGDPKQSIYLFREARVEFFVRAMQEGRIEDLPLHRLRLSANFRSQENLVHAFNETFHHVFRDDPQIPYEAVTANIEATEHTLHWRTATLPQQVNSTKTDSTEKQRYLRDKTEWEAKHIVESICEWAAQNPEKPYDVAVLVRTKQHAVAVIQQLRSANIPVHALEMDPLHERPEVLDLLALTRALLHPADRTAWLAVLRAPWCGASMANLHMLTAGDEATQRTLPLLSIAEERVANIPGAMQKRIKKTLAVMRLALEQQGRLPIAEWVERTWRTLGGNSYLKDDELSNTRRYFDMLEKLEKESNPVSIEMLKQRLEGLSANSGSAGDAVQVLTIHKAKGLEWDLVLVPSLEKIAAIDRRPLLDWGEVLATGGDDATVLLAPIESKGEEASTLNKFLSSVRHQKQLAEIKRLFYVAATRARKQVYLYGSLATKQDGSITPRSGTLLHAAWNAAEQYFQVPYKVFDPFTDPQSNLLVMPSSDEKEDFALAAVAEKPTPPKISRVPDDFDATAKLASSRAPRATTKATEREFTRPTGSFFARAAGDTTHIFLEQLAKRAATTSLHELRTELPGWSERIERLAASHGLDKASSRQAASTAMRALITMLESENGRWLLTAHSGAESELPLFITTDDGSAYSYRVDRTFLAGPSVLSLGESHRWIVDFKTTSSQGNTDAFLKQQMEVYGAQLDAYARAFLASREETRPIMLALYYPLIDRFVCWQYAEEGKS